MNSPTRILIVDDDEHLLRFTQELLAPGGYDFATATTGAAGLARAQAFRPDIVLLDVALPDLDGCEVCGRLKADPSLQGVLVVLVSGQCVAGPEQTRGLRSGADSYLMRPFDPEYFQARIETLARLSQTERHLRQANQQLEAQVRTRDGEGMRATFLRLAEQLNAATTLRGAGDALFAAADELLGWDAAFLGVSERGPDDLLVVAFYDTIDGRRVDFSDVNDRHPSLLARGVMRDGPRLIHRADAGQEGASLQPAGNEEQRSECLLFVPLRIGERCVGILSIQSYTPHAYDDRDLRTLSALADHCSIAVERTRTEEALKAAKRELELANSHLEAEVARRTRQLAESEARYRDLVESSPDWVWETDEHGLYRFSNGRVRDLLGYEPKEVLGRHAFEFLSPEDRQRIAGLAQPTMDRGEAIHCLVNTCLHRDGHRVVIETSANPVRDAEGRIRGYRGLDRDITVRREAEIRSERYAAELADLYNLAPCGYHSVDADGIFLQINDTELAWLGYTREELVGRRRFHDLIAPADLERVAGEFDQFKGRGWARDVEFSILRKDGSELPVVLNSVTSYSEAGEYLRNRTTLFDNTRQQRTAAELRQARDSAQAANRAKNTFLANISHEIRTPLNALLGNAQLLNRHPGLPAELRTRIDFISRSGEHLLALLNDVLELSRIEAGRQVATPVCFDLPALIGDVAEMVRWHADPKGLALHVTSADDVPRLVVADQGKLRQILLNLLGNAVKFTERGEVRVRTSLHPDREAGHRLIAEVSDTGPGIPLAERDRLFHYFEQTSTGRRLQSGTGIGLAISRHYARLMGGDLTLVDTDAAGCTFRCEIPLGTSAADALTPEEGGTSTSARRHPGVGFVPIEETSAAPGPATEAVLTGIARLPTAWREEMTRAITAGQTQDLAKLLDRAAAQHPIAATHLRALADVYEFDGLCRLLSSPPEP